MVTPSTTPACHACSQISISPTGTAAWAIGDLARNLEASNSIEYSEGPTSSGKSFRYRPPRGVISQSTLTVQVRPLTGTALKVASSRESDLPLFPRS